MEAESGVAIIEAFGQSVWLVMEEMAFCMCALAFWGASGDEAIA
jgi:hypothetical protein